ncbi:CRT (chloroquine-resistance transporter)-like transporter [Klebsormidium nitens]|uniref:CRT (Chloroquine-resistance transporter)-like transporter n=1 Tax=Klebsormidium nitens TaxID=105231 RepID=A0A0U9I7Q3_KLENI|nr:CRT (chloroquine-resistance transporter)-like transporter [Klebsormidium nitens]|eukprot:GAQ86420.1 CRT (chloroquine-resistance transporter)-like transporter [Klebsormidium nitens]
MAAIIRQGSAVLPLNVGTASAQGTLEAGSRRQWCHSNSRCFGDQATPFPDINAGSWPGLGISDLRRASRRLLLRRLYRADPRGSQLTQQQGGCVRCSLPAAEEAPIVSSHTHALGGSPVGAASSFEVPHRARWPWPLVRVEQAQGPQGVGHAQILCPDFGGASKGSRPGLRLRLPRPLFGRPPRAIPALGVTQQELLLVLGAGGLVLLAVLNKILFKMAIASMPDQPFVLANICTFGYLVLYSGIVCHRWRRGAVSPDMLRYPKTKFVCIGALEAAGAMLGLFAAGYVPGTILPILSQGYLVWQLVLSAIFLRRRYSLGQLVGVVVSLAGIATVVTNAHAGPGVLASGPSFVFPCLYLLSASFSAAASLVKERLFQEAPQHLGAGRSLDLFVVNLLGSAFQFMFLLLLLPLVASARGVPPPALPAHLATGAGCFLGHAAVGGAPCHGAPLLPLVYITTNLAFNVAQLALLKATTAVVPSIALTLAVPLSVAAFTLPLPLLGTPCALPPSFVSGTFILLAGLIMYVLSGKQQPTQVPRPTLSLQPHFERAVATSTRQGLTPRVRVLSKRWAHGP